MKSASKSLLLLTLAVALATPATAAVEALVVDRAHSTVDFHIRHFVSKVRGEFTDFAGTIRMDEGNPANSSVEFTIQAKSINTRNERRDGHLRSADFFDVENHPTITFKSTKVEKPGASGYRVTGDLTIRGVTKRVELPVTYLGRTKDARGAMKAGFETETVLDRKDFGITWNAPADNGLMLGDEVQVSIALEVTEPRPEAAKPASS